MTRVRSRRAAVRAAAITLALVTAPLFTAPESRAQEFAEPVSGEPSDSPQAFLERGCPPHPAALAFQTSFVRWHGVADLDTRAAALAAGGATWRVAAGVSQSGTGELLAHAGALALGHVTEAAGVGLRGLLRREPAAIADTPLGRGVGVDVGAGVWIRAARSVRVWASAPQAWSRGAGPALRRPLSIGVSGEIAGLTAWLERTAPAFESDVLGMHALGARLDGGGAAVWCELMDRPVRGSIGVEAHAGGLVACARVDDHPVLGESVRVSLRWLAP